MTRLDLAYLTASSTETRAFLWCVLNARAWPQILPHPEPDSERATSIRIWIQRDIGLTTCLEMWNRLQFYRGVQWVEKNHAKAIRKILKND